MTAAELRAILSAHYAVNDRLKGGVDDLVRQIMAAIGRKR